MSWTNYFDKIFIISLMKDGTLSRLFATLKQLAVFDIDTELFEATYNENGAVGLRDTVIKLFTECIDKGYNNILVFEDDINIIEDINKYMPLCLHQLPYDYDLLYLGAYVVSPFKEKYSENLLVLDKALTTHAIAYSKKTMEKMLKIFTTHSENPRDTTTIDMLLLNRVLTQGKSYISYPLLVSQQTGYSIIEKKEVDYTKYIEQSYAEQLNKLNEILSH